jgi:hypothetical protein
MHKNQTSGTIARDIINILRPNSGLRITQKERQVSATKASIEWRKNNPEKATQIAKMGGENSKTEEGRNRCSKVGKKYGPENAVKYIPIETKKRNGTKYGKQNLVGEIMCEKCGRITNKGNYAQSHGQNCRELDKIKFIDLLPNIFTTSEMKKIANANNIDWIRLNILHHTCIYISIKEKGKFPFQMNPNIYSKNKKEINKVKKYINK